MKKYKLLRFGRSYVNKQGDIKIMLITGDQKTGYVALFDCQHPAVVFHTIYLGSRIVLNDGNWTELDKSNVNEASTLTNYVIQMERVKTSLIDSFHSDLS